MIASLARLLVILVVSLGAAAAYVQGRGWRWVPDPAVLQKEEKLRGDRKAIDGEPPGERKQSWITLEQLVSFIEQGAIVVDARDAAHFAAGHLEAPTIINIPGEEAGEHIGRLSPDVVMGRPIVIYCNSEECDLADLVYKALKDLYQYDQMYIYHQGWDGIEKARLPTTTAPETDLTFYGFADESTPDGTEPPATEPQPEDDGG